MSANDSRAAGTCGRRGHWRAGRGAGPVPQGRSGSRRRAGAGVQGNRRRIQLGPNVFRMFAYLGLTEEMNKWAAFPRGLEMRDAITGETVAELPVDDRFYQKYHAPYAVIHRADMLNEWSKGKVTLLGDAAHPMLQYLAQGANMALEDAVCLAEQAAAHGGDYATAFKAYQEIRYLRTARVQLMARVFGEVYHASGVSRELRNQVIGEWTAQGGVDISWLYGHQPGLPRIENVAVPKQALPF